MLAVIVFAVLELGLPFRDGMVLQRELSVPIHGKCAANKVVSVNFAGQKKTAKSDNAGNWLVWLDPLKASAKGRELVVSAERETKTLKDVVVGEVWFCAGQSNMGVPLCNQGNPRYRDEAGATMAQIWRKPNIRYLANWGSGCEWFAFTPKNLRERHILAAAAYFAIDLEDALDSLPIGLVGVCQGATGIQQWLVEDGEKWQEFCEKLSPFAARGMLWYQGEHDAMRHPERELYNERMHKLLKGWKAKWGCPELKMIYTQLCAYQSGYADMQEVQAQFERENEDAFMVVANDVGSITDIHPNRKGLVGHRWALHALRRVYGFEDVQDNSPTLESCKAIGDKVEITFKDAGELYIWKRDWREGADKNMDKWENELFEVAGADGQWKVAKVVNFKLSEAWGGGKCIRGEFEGGNKIVIKSDEVKKPVKARYFHAKPFYEQWIYNEWNLPMGAWTVEVKK